MGRLLFFDNLLDVTIRPISRFIRFFDGVKREKETRSLMQAPGDAVRFTDFGLQVHVVCFAVMLLLFLYLVSCWTF